MVATRSARAFVLLVALTSAVWAGARPHLVNSVAEAAPLPRSVFSDFNGDGYPDLAVGSYGEAVGTVPNSGLVHVLYGQAAGPQGTSPDDQLWTQDSPGVQDSVEASDVFGRWLVACDFNADGYADLAVGAYGETVGTISMAGAVTLLYGSPVGIQADAPDDQFWTQDSPGVEDTAEANDNFGRFMVVGDFNADTYCDLAVNVDGEDVGATVDAGAVNVLYGSAGGLQTDAPADQFWTQDMMGDSAEAEDYFGRSMEVGDFNVDGRDDLVIAAYQEDIGALTDAGWVGVIFGSASGLQAASPGPQAWTQDSPNVEDQAESDDLFGRYLAAGDYNADGNPDLAVGSYEEDVGSAVDAGAVSVLYGSPAGLQVDSPLDQFWTQGSGGLSDTAESGDYWARSLNAGDFNNDGFDDLAVGAWGEDVGAIADGGSVSVLYGSPSGLQASAPDDQLWTEDSPGVKEVAESGDGFGHTMWVDDFNLDGFDDLVVGVYHEDVGTLTDAGVFQLLYGGASGLQASSPDDQVFSQGGSLQDKAEANDRFGWSFA